MSAFHDLCRLAYTRFGEQDLTQVEADTLIDELAALDGVHTEMITNMRKLFAGRSAEDMLNAASEYFENKPLPPLLCMRDTESGE